MRDISISVYKRPNTDDNEFVFLTNNKLTNPNQEEQVYQFLSLQINRSVQTSNLSGSIIFGMNRPLNRKNVIRSGQLIQISDSGNIKFQGVLFISYESLPISSQGGSAGMYMIGTLMPNIYYLTLAPMIFNSDQAKQISDMLKVDVPSFLVGNDAQKVKTDDLLNYIVTNTDYSNFFNKKIKNYDLPDSVYLMASADMKKDSVLRASIDFTNCVMYQQEDGTIVIRQLDANVKCPFSLDVSNQAFGSFNQGTSSQNSVSMLNFKYNDNSAITPAIVSNYCMVSSEISISNDVESLIVSYTPNKKFYPRIDQLLKSGWFVAQMSNTQLNTNIISDPTLKEVIEGYRSNQDQYINSSNPIGVNQEFYTAYQEMITAKQLGQALTGYASIKCTISLDDPNYPTDNANNILGSCVEIQNCDMEKGLIAVTCERYGASGSYIDLNIVPLGSITGYWKN